MKYGKPVTDIIEERFSCRRHPKNSIVEEMRQRLAGFIAAHQTGPFDSPTRFELVTAMDADRQALRGLGTYGFIRNPAGFIIGATRESKYNLEDFGYTMEQIILFATDIGLGTCWLGGTFTKSSFAKRISAGKDELVPAVTSIGYTADNSVDGRIRRWAGGAHRYAWDRLFFDRQFRSALSREAAGAYTVPLEMVRLGPSASNKQPWRILKDGNIFHFYLQRTEGYRNSVAFKVLGIADMQRLDMGIAMCHFELTARERGLKGKWGEGEPSIERPTGMMEYTVSWIGE